jgi:DNA polymerase
MDLFEYAYKNQKKEESINPNIEKPLWENSQYDFVSTLEELKQIALECRKCKLCLTRKNVVFGEGNPNADLMFIGEGPGKTEDETGRPFVGLAGQLLTRIIENGLKISRENVYIANVVKCRPTVEMKGEKDRPPDEEEVNACSPYLIRQIELIKPKIIITLGNPSTRFLLNTKLGITKLRGNVYYYKDIAVVPTYHPSFVLRNGGENSLLKKDVWEDMKIVLKLMQDLRIKSYKINDK